MFSFTLGNGCGCGRRVINAKSWPGGADRSRLEEQPSCLWIAVKMMFEHQMGSPLGLYRKPSRVETAKRFWRVSGSFLVCFLSKMWHLEQVCIHACRKPQVSLEGKKGRAGYQCFRGGSLLYLFLKTLSSLVQKKVI